jgi:hypothetical protein
MKTGRLPPPPFPELTNSPPPTRLPLQTFPSPLRLLFYSTSSLHNPPSHDSTVVIGGEDRLTETGVETETPESERRLTEVKPKRIGVSGSRLHFPEICSGPPAKSAKQREIINSNFFHDRPFFRQNHQRETRPPFFFFSNPHYAPKSRIRSGKFVFLPITPNGSSKTSLISRGG